MINKRALTADEIKAAAELEYEEITFAPETFPETKYCNNSLKEVFVNILQCACRILFHLEVYCRAYAVGKGL